MVLLVLSKDPMSPYRKPMPSFTLVLTSGHHSYRPSTIQLSPAVPPTAPDFLMVCIWPSLLHFRRFQPMYCQKTIRHSSMDDEFVGDCGEDVDSQTIFEAERPATIDPVAEQTKTSPVKVCLFLIISNLYWNFLWAESFLPHPQICVL